MGFFDSILGMFGIGQPKLAMTLAAGEVKRGGMVSGTIRITGGNRPLPIAAIIVKFQQKKERKTEQGKTTDTNNLAEVNLPQGGKEIRPGETLEFSFTLQAPKEIQPVGGDIKGYFISGSADTPGWDPEDVKPIAIGEGVDAMASEDTHRFHVLPTERSFRHSSVKGDYRLERWAGGFVATWKTALSVRNADGSPRHRISGWGKSLAVSPDGTRIVTSDAHKRVAVFDLASGEGVGDPVQLTDWIFDLAWTKDGTILASSSDKIFLLSADLSVSSTLENLDGASFYVGGLWALPDSSFVVTDSNGSRILRVTLQGQTVAKMRAQNPGTIHGSGSFAAIDSHRSIQVIDENLKDVARFDLPGKEGVRYVGQSEHSHTHFKAMPRLSPDGQQMLVQDGSGALFRLDRKGNPVLLYSREVLEYVEDTLWLDAQHFVAITNDGMVRICGIADGTAVFADQDA